MRFLLAACLSLMWSGANAADAAASPPVGWIWKAKNAAANEKVFFRKEFRLSKEVASASVEVTADNWQRFVLNGKDFGFSADWSAPQNYDVKAALLPKENNVLTVESRNAGGVAAMALRLVVTFKDGTKLKIVSDESWQCSSEASGPWTSAVVVGRMGDAPWGDVMGEESSGSQEVKDVTKDYQVAKDFRLERIHHVAKSQGSWVAMTVDGKGHLLCSDQYGQIYRVTPGIKDKPTVVEPAGIKLGGAHGLLWHAGVLYVTVNEGSDESGVWMVTDSSGDAPPGAPKLIKAMEGRGEHGPHGMALSPDGKSIYLTAGNFTDPAQVDFSLVNRAWEEDQLLPRIGDPKGHARDRMAPGGWIARFKLDGSDWQLFAAGFRNAYDLAFNDRGDLFTYDSDMEWDLGMPWYRPTRICYVLPGAEFGWRNGSGPWPEYYEDSMEPLLNVGPGSPTGVVSGKGAKFPAKYQRAVYALDWTYATIYAIHMTPDGAGYKGEREEFVSGNGLPLTDAVIGADGAMYFLSGGRKTDSSLWRVTYTGKEAVRPVPYEAKPLQLADKAVCWDGMGAPLRLTRYQSRLTVETLPVADIAARLAKETNAWQAIGGAMALARTGAAAHREVILSALDRVDWMKLDVAQKINWLRACELVFIRSGEPKPEERTRILAKVDAAFPAKGDELNRELCRLLSYLQAPEIVGRTLALMDSAGPTPAPDWLELAKRNARYGKTVADMIANLPPAQVIHYMYCLRVVKGPWKENERERFFGWFQQLDKKKGGESYAGFVSVIRKDAIASATVEEQQMIAKLESGVKPTATVEKPKAKGPGRTWTIDEVAKLGEGGLKGDRENGRRMFEACLCLSCHRVGSEGGGAGPDLTTVAGRFQIRDLAEAILDPGKVVSDQYAFDSITLTDGSQLFGKVVEEKDQHWLVATNPFDMTQTTEIERSRIKGLKPSPQSPMPPALINQLNPDELKDLMSYLLNK